MHLSKLGDLSEHLSFPAAEAAQMSSNCQDKHLQGCPMLNFCSLNELRNQGTVYLFYI